MDAGGVVLSAAVAGFFAAAVLAVVRPKLGYAVSLAASLLLFAAAVEALAGGAVHGLAWSGPLSDPEGLALDGLSGFFALAASVVWIATSGYSIAYDDRRSPLLAICFSLTLGSIALLVASTSLLLFLLAWETMTVASYGMILQARGRPDRVFSAGFVFLTFGEASTLFVLVAFAGLRVGTGTFAESPLTAGGVLPTLVFVAALLGFALKMGVAPFHMSEWLPIAHSSAPSNASAVLSSTLTLAGAYGLFRVLSLLGSPPLWWGAVTLAIGAISALLGALFAAVSEHTKGLPAYSTIENNGLILVALGVAMLARAEGLTDLYVFALFAAFFQALAHAVAKTALFLAAGWTEHATGSFDLTSVQGGVKRDERAGFAGTLAAALSLAAAPPLAGFVSEWMILESLFQSYQFVPAWVQFLGLVAGAAVALAAGLIVIAMVKFVGFAVLWDPRGAVSARRSRGLSVPIGAVGAVVLGLGVGAPWVLRFLAPAVSAFAGRPASAPVGGLLSVPNGWSILSGAPFGILSPPMVPIALAAGAMVAVGYHLLGRRHRRGVRRSPPWMAGSAPGQPGEVFTSFGYSTGLRLMMSSVLGTREIRSGAGPVRQAELATPVPYSVELEVLDVFKLFYDDLVRAAEAISSVLKGGVMTGRLGRYLAYILLVVLLVVVYVAAAFA
ncbi:MAG TPA: proton-conducting transporter membrane subunit [Thermoplasmata archaeon]|nr:proton-conducting transporter membrane subunit [Thermoplasmata archaeon]